MLRDIYYAKYYGKGARGNGQPGGKNEIRRKKEENYIKKGEKVLKNAFFGAINAPAAN